MQGSNPAPLSCESTVQHYVKLCQAFSTAPYAPYATLFLLIEIFGLVTYVVSTAMTMILVWHVELVNALLPIPNAHHLYLMCIENTEMFCLSPIKLSILPVQVNTLTP